MRGFTLFFPILVLFGSCHSFPFLWPSSFRGSKVTTTVTTTTQSGPPHPHAHHSGLGHIGGVTTTVTGQPHSSHLHIRPAVSVADAYLVGRPLPPHLMGSPYHHHLHHHRPLTGSNTHLHVHGGAIGHRHHLHHAHGNQPHQHHHHLTRSLTTVQHPHAQSTVVHHSN